MSKLDITIYDLFREKDDSAYVLVDIKKINNYINLAKVLETEHEALKKDVARYFELFMNRDRNIHESTEMLDLFVKLSKVGKKSD